MHPTRRPIATSLAAFLIVCIALVLVPATPAGADGIKDRFPKVAAVKKLFPLVNGLEIESDYDGGVFFPSCAGVEDPDTSGLVNVWIGAYNLPDTSPSRATRPYPWVYKFATARKAKRVMRQVRSQVNGCLGFREDVDTYSRISKMNAPNIGDDTFGFQAMWGTTFEGVYYKYRSVWIRSGKWILDAQVRRHPGKVPAKKTRAFARLLYRTGG
ncbi:hypothetical protein [Nocardioides pelophilus]|uniref:hypothetical protein n=1 Tax=Nocardioides pelophilus TaxID=2172019 RepID=UPI0015FFB3BF|nr:hypothetical protein [Nocardioides pelophilus]